MDLNLFTPQEIEFQADNEMITIVPEETMDALYMAQGTFGPFHPPSKTKVPLWLAAALRKREKCKIQTPQWMNEEFLKRVLETEEFDILPFHYLEVAHVLVGCARQDIPDHGEVIKLIQKIYEVRKTKARASLKQLKQIEYKAQYAGFMEINDLKPFLITAFNQLTKFQSDGPEAADEDMDY